MTKVRIGSVTTFPGVKPGKEQVMKIAEETCEVYSAWERRNEFSVSESDDYFTSDLLDECADVIMATCNLIAALGVEDFAPYIKECKMRNVKRGRYGESERMMKK